jgi:acetyl esterase/lipase
MKRLARCLSSFSAVTGLLLLIRAPSGLVGGMLWLPKLLAGAWAPFTALAGGFGALFGLLSKDRAAANAGLFGAWASLSHIARVLALRADFSQGWPSPPSGDAAALPPQRLPRYRLVQPSLPPIPGERDIPLWIDQQSRQPLLGDVWSPPPGVRHSGLAVIYLHGGLWQALDKGFLTQPLFRRLAGQGHVILDLAYSLAPQAEMPRMLSDVKRAIAWLKTHADEYNVNPEHIVLVGVSGGGHLALLAAYTPNQPAFQPDDLQVDTSVRGVVVFSAVTDLAAFYNQYGQSNPGQPEYSAQIDDRLRPRIYDHTPLERWLTRVRVFPAYRHANLPGGALLLVYLLGGTLKEAPEAYRRFSPLTHVSPHCPPTLQFTGDNDFVIDASHGKRLHQALRQAGVPSIYIEYPDSVHAFHMYFGVSPRVAPAAQVSTYDLERFLALLS